MCACVASTWLLQTAYDALLAEEEALAKEIAEEEKQRQAQLASMREKMGAAHDEL
jgi:phage shock protein A